MREKQLENELMPVIGIMGPILLSELSEYLDAAQLEGRKVPTGLGGTPVNLLARRLLDLGYQLVIFTLDKDVEEELILDGPRLRICVGPYRNRAKHRALDFFAKERRYLREALSRESVDVIHAHWTYEFSMAAQTQNIPLIITAHDAPFSVLRAMFDPYRIIRTIMACLVVRKAKLIVSVSPYVSSHLSRYFFYRGPGFVIPNGLPDSHFNHEKAGRSDKEKLTFATILPGWNRLKNGKLAIQAFNLHHSKCPNDRLIMFGAGHGVNEGAFEWAKGLSCFKSIEFAGATPYEECMNRLSREVDVLVHPSIEEAQPMALNEALAIGIPVIGGLSSGGVPWTVGPGLTDLLVNINSPREMAEKMMLISSDWSSYQRFSSAAKELAQERYRIRATADHYISIYQSLMNTQLGDKAVESED